METVVWKLRIKNLIRLFGVGLLLIGAWNFLGVLIFDSQAFLTGYRDVFAPILSTGGGPIYIIEDVILMAAGVAISWFI